MRGRSIKTLTSAMLALCTSAASAEIYKWTDADGNVLFSDRPPAGVTKKPVEVRSAAPSAGSQEELEARRQRQARALRGAERRIEKRKEGALRKAADAEALKVQRRACIDARKAYDVLSQRAPVYKADNGRYRVAWINDAYEGERAYVDDADRERVLNDAARSIYELCEDPASASAQAQAVNELIREEKCEAERADLEMAERPQAKTTNDELKQRRNRVKALCGG